MTMSEGTGRLPREVRASGPPLPFGDARLARRAAAGDERAFAAIYRRYHQDLYRYCLALLRDREDAEDALQATMVKALRALPGERAKIELKPWLFRIAHNEAISLVRRRRPTDEIDPELPESGTSRNSARSRASSCASWSRIWTTCRSDSAGAAGDARAERARLRADRRARSRRARRPPSRPSTRRGSALQEMSEGRELECGRVREAISAGDRRVLRGRRIRAHLRTCQGCRSSRRRSGTATCSSGGTGAAARGSGRPRHAALRARGGTPRLPRPGQGSPGSGRPSAPGPR